MSAFLCEPRHIGALAAWTWLNGRGHSLTQYAESAQDLAVLWASANLTSVAHLYTGGDVEKAAQDFQGRSATDYGAACSQASRYTLYQLAPVAVLKMLACLEYQSCEHRGYHDSDAYHALHRAERVAIRQLDGYDAAPWELSEEAFRALPRRGLAIL